MSPTTGKNIVSHSHVGVYYAITSRVVDNLKAESLIDKAIETKYIGGVYGNQRPTEFLCLILKLLQIQPEKEILVEYLRADEFKYAMDIC